MDGVVGGAEGDAAAAAAVSAVAKPATKEEVKRELGRIGCCSCCQLRFVSERYHGTYQAVLEQPVEPAAAPCPVCLGVFQVSFPELVQRICAQLVAEGRTFDSFFLSVATPLQMAIRGHSVWVHLLSTFEQYGGKDEEATVPTIKEVVRWVLQAMLVRDNAIGPKFTKNGDLEIKLDFHHAESAEEWKIVHRLDPSRFRPKRKRHGRHRQRHDDSEQSSAQLPATSAVADCLRDVADHRFRSIAGSPPAAATTLCQLPECHFTHAPVWVAGRYCKFSRELSQTPWLIGGERKSAFSVEELLCDHVKKRFRADNFKFSAAGREDVDVRTLGDGRPFAIEVLNPKENRLGTAVMVELQRETNNFQGERAGLVSCQDLQMVPRADIAQLKQGEETKKKTYCCVVWLSEDLDEERLHKITSQKNLTLAQSTPIRVSHRRSMLVRSKVVHWMRHKKLAPNFVKLWLCTQAGCYIKEFVHGDFGRTKPSLGTLLDCEADIISLDVTAVDLPFPSPLAAQNALASRASPAEAS